jgi:hypothetical protein
MGNSFLPAQSINFTHLPNLMFQNAIGMTCLTPFDSFNLFA